MNEPLETKIILSQDESGFIVFFRSKKGASFEREIPGFDKNELLRYLAGLRDASAHFGQPVSAEEIKNSSDENSASQYLYGNPLPPKMFQEVIAGFKGEDAFNIQYSHA